MIRGAMAVAAWAWASAAFAQASAPAQPPALVQTAAPDLIQGLNAPMFVGGALSAPVVVLPPSVVTPFGDGWRAPAPAGDAPAWANRSSALGAGTTVTLWSPGGIRQRLEAMGVKDGDKVFRGESRVYVFAAVHGQAVGMNLQGLQRAGWSTDTSSAMVGDGQVGVGWRKGGFEADLGYVHRSIHFAHTPIGVSDSYADDIAAVSFSFHPNW